MYSSCPTYFITTPSGSFIPSLFTILPFFIVRMPHFFIQNSMLMSVLNTCTIITSVFVCSSLLAYSFESSINNKWFNFLLSPFKTCIYLLKNQRQYGSILNTSNNGDRLSPWNIPLFTWTFPRSSPFAVNDSLHCCILSYKSVLKFSAVPNIHLPSYVKQGYMLLRNLSILWIDWCVFYCNPLKPSYQSIVDPLFHDFLFCILIFSAFMLLFSWRCSSFNLSHFRSFSHSASLLCSFLAPQISLQNLLHSSAFGTFFDLTSFLA